MKSPVTQNVVLDSFALIAHFKKEKGYELISELFSEIALGGKQGFISVINVGEVYYMLHRKVGMEMAEKALTVISTLPIEIVEADFEATYQAAKLKAKNQISFADAFAAALTISKKGILITGDPEFKTIKEKDFKIKFINS